MYASLLTVNLALLRNSSCTFLLAYLRTEGETSVISLSPSVHAQSARAISGGGQLIALSDVVVREAPPCPEQLPVEAEHPGLAHRRGDVLLAGERKAGRARQMLCQGTVLVLCSAQRGRMRALRAPPCGPETCPVNPKPGLCWQALCACVQRLATPRQK